MDTVRVLRVIEYVGPREWVEAVVAKSIHGTMCPKAGCTIRGATIGEFPEILDKAEKPREGGTG